MKMAWAALQLILFMVRQALGNCSMRRLPTVGALSEAPTVGALPPACPVKRGRPSVQSTTNEINLLPFVLSLSKDLIKS